MHCAVVLSARNASTSSTCFSAAVASRIDIAACWSSNVVTRQTRAVRSAAVGAASGLCYRNRTRPPGEVIQPLSRFQPRRGLLIQGLEEHLKG